MIHSQGLNQYHFVSEKAPTEISETRNVDQVKSSRQQRKSTLIPITQLYQPDTVILFNKKFETDNIGGSVDPDKAEEKRIYTDYNGVKGESPYSQSFFDNSNTSNSYIEQHLNSCNDGIKGLVDSLAKPEEYIQTLKERIEQADGQKRELRDQSFQNKLRIRALEDKVKLEKEINQELHQISDSHKA
ncbi:uncharacterized protein L201_005742 [Kwoniella dendrophila CBS 6074]|uniref:Uncharacterized protein n=1 Tax=Kwoniella dendrophila CBS 6074 TaxID=1295534 RepID=A0AAX4JZJ0_9TREE